MATRFYFRGNEAAAVSPAFGAWDENASTVRRRMTATKAELTEGFVTPAYLAWTAGNTALEVQYVSDPLAAGNAFTTSTALKSYIRGQESVAADNARERVLVKVISQDGNTLRATLLSLGQYGPDTE